MAPAQQDRERERFLKAAISLRGNPDFETIRDEIDRRYRDLCFGFHKLPDEAVRKSQGRAAELFSLLQDLDAGKAVEELERAKRNITTLSKNPV